MPEKHIRELEKNYPDVIFSACFEGMEQHKQSSSRSYLCLHKCSTHRKSILSDLLFVTHFEKHPEPITH